MTLALVSLERQVAEKLHAYTRTYKGGGTTRARDLVDLLLIRQHGRVDTVELTSAILTVFESRATHRVPESLAPPPQALEPAFRREAESVGVVSELSEAHHLLAEWLDPVLGEVHRRCLPAACRPPPRCDDRPVSPAQFRRIALGLRDVVEQSHHGHPDFRVGGRIFATLGYPNTTSGMAILTPDQQRTFLRDYPGVFVPAAGTWGERGSTMVLLDAAGQEAVGEALTLAWRNAVEKGPSRPARRKQRK